jgi:DNA polymerase-1
MVHFDVVIPRTPFLAIYREIRVSRKRLYLVDGMSQIYRAYFAIPKLANSKGLPTNATFGFTTMLRKLIQDVEPDYIGVAFDLEGPTVRHERFEGYKATRKPMPDDLQQQIPFIRRVCEVFCVPVIGFPGYEADDVIGTLARKAVARNLDVMIVTSDKDMLQLVDGHVRVLDPRKDNLILDADKVVEKMGVTPVQIPDLLALMGDTIDNIPGAKGIGEKGARELIQTFGSAENTLQNWAQVKRKNYQQSLRDNADVVRTSRELATIYCDLEIDLDLGSLVLRPPDRKAAFGLFAELEFKALMGEFAPVAEVAAERTPRLTGAEARACLERLAEEPRVFFTICCTSDAAVRRRVQQACVRGESGRGCLLDLADADAAPAWGRLLASERVAKVCWDWKLALAAHRNTGIALAGRIDDAMLAAFLTAPHLGDYTLRRWALDRLHLKLPDDPPATRQLPLGAPGEPASASDDRLAAELDALCRLFAELDPELDRLGLRPLYERIELPLVPILAAMERAGVRIDRAILDEMSVEMETELAGLTAAIHAAAGCEFNINSNKQLAEVLFEKLNLPTTRKTRTGGYSTDQSVLEELAESYEIPRLLLQYRQIAKLKSTYVDALPALIDRESGRVHTSFNQTGAATGRVSSSDPNLQNIPIRTELGRLIRRAFVAAPGDCLVSADYSQIELRVLAHLSGDPVLVEAFRANEDIHARTAREVFGPLAEGNPAEYRRRAKVINFGIVYGLSAFGLAQRLQIGRDEAQAFIDAYFERYRGIRQWIDHTLEEVRSTGQTRTLFGRIRPIPDIRSRDFNVRTFAERTAVNSPIQGTAADILKLAMIAVYKSFQSSGISARMTLQVHDELVVETPREASDEVRARLRREMEQAAELAVPLVVETRAADNWKDAK